MKLSINRNDLLTALRKLQPFTHYGTLEILSNVLLIANQDDHSLSIAATNLDSSAKTLIDCNVTESGRLTVDARTLSGIISTMEGDSIDIETGSRLEVRAGNAVSKIGFTEGNDFPETPKHNGSWQTIDSNVLVDFVNSVAYAASREDSRPVLNGILFEVDSNKIRMVATDGHRMAYVDRDNTLNLEPAKAIVPASFLRSILPRLETVIDIAVTHQHMFIRSGMDFFSVRLLNGQFPNYRMVMPDNIKTRVSINRGAFLSGLRIVSMVSDKLTKQVNIKMANREILISSSGPSGDARTTIETEYDRDPISMAFNSSYLTDLLTAYQQSESVMIGYNDPGGPVTFTPECDSLTLKIAVVMPMVV